MTDLSQLGIQLGLILALSFLVGMEREHNIIMKNKVRTLGGVRTFPLLGLASYLFARSPYTYVAGLLVLGALLVMEYRGKIEGDQHGLTTEFSALVVYALGPLVAAQQYWMAIATATICALLLQMKTPLEALAKRISTEELLTFSQFILLSAVILPLVPNTAYTQFELNPYRIWLIVVAVSGVSYLSYMLQRWRGARLGLFFAGVLGGVYSSTITTIALARQGRNNPQQARTFIGAIIAATGMMYFRIIVLVWLFAPALGRNLLVPFVIAGLSALASAFFFAKRQRSAANNGITTLPEVNPLQLSTAALFAVVFILITLATRFTVEHFGQAGLYTLAVVMGPTDIDPFIMSLTGATNFATTHAVLAIGLAVASNNIFKAIYTWGLLGKKTGRAVLAVFAVISFLPLLLLLVL